MHVRRIDHVNLRTPLLEESVAFYTKLLGLRRGLLPGIDPTRNAWLYDLSDQPIIHVNLPPNDEPVPDASHSGRIHHIALDCMNYDLIRQTISDMALPYEENHVESIGLRQLFVKDPNGVLLELNFHSQTQA